MLKSFVTLATLASLATGVAAQQSAPVIFGLLDLSVQHLRSGDRSPMGGAHMNRLADGVLYGPGSRWGIRVLEDLGGGLNAFALLEAGLNGDTGTLGQGGRGFGRQAYLGLRSAQAGELRLGRQYTLHDETMFVLNAAGSITPLNPGAAWTLPTGAVPLFIDAPRVDNAIHYLSPVLGGFRVQAMVALGEGVMDRYQGVKASYAQGPITVAAAYEQGKASAPPVGGSSNVNKVLEFGGNYDFGAFALYGGYQRGRDLTAGPRSQIQVGTLNLPGLTGPATSLSAYTLGAAAPLGVTRLTAEYTRTKYSSDSGGDITAGRIGVGANYSLSKRTSVYGTVSFMTGDLKDFVNEKQLYQLGLRTAF